MSAAVLILTATGVYMGVGALVAIGFVTFGVNRVDASARAGTWGFRALIAPGCAALWPIVLGWWLARRQGAS